MTTETKPRKSRGCLFKSLVYVILPIFVLSIAAAIWAGRTFIYWGPERTVEDYAGKLIQMSASAQNAEPDDHRAPDAFEAIYKRYIELEKDELGLEEAKQTSFTNRETMTTDLWDETWTVEEIEIDYGDDRRWDVTTFHVEGWQEAKATAYRLFDRFEAEGMTAKLDEALALPGFVPRATSSYELSREGLSGLIASASIERIRAQRAIEAGDVDTVLVCLGRLAAIQRFLHGYPEFEGALRSVGLLEYVSGIARASVLHEGFTTEELARINGALEPFEAPPVTKVAEYSRIYTIGAMEATLRKGFSSKRASFSYHAALMDEAIDDLLKWLETPRPERGELKAWYWSPPANPIADYNNHATYAAVPMLPSYCTFSDAGMTTLDGYRLLIAIEGHNRRHGQPPQSLGNIDSDLLPAGLQDRYAPDGKFRYILYNEPDRFGREYALYSLAGDCQDNGGFFHQIDIRKDDVLGDFIFNRPPLNDLQAHTKYWEENAERLTKERLDRTGSAVSPKR